MKLTEGFELRTLAGHNIAVPASSKNIDFSHVLILNETALTLWKHMAKGDFTANDLARVLTGTYEVSQEEATADVGQLLENMRELGMIED